MEAFPDLDLARATDYLDLLCNLERESSNPLSIANLEATELLNSFRCGEALHEEAAGKLSEQIRQFRLDRDLEGERNAKKQEDYELRMKRSFAKLLHQYQKDFLISFLMGRGVLPSFAFPINVMRLHVLREEFNSNLQSERRSTFRFERDGKIALSEYAPGGEVIAGKRIYGSVGLRKFPALEFDHTNWFRWCDKCNGIDIWSG